MIRLSPSGPFVSLQQLLDGYGGVITGIHKVAPILAGPIAADGTILATCPITVTEEDLANKKRVMGVARMGFEFATPGNSATNLVCYVQMTPAPPAGGPPPPPVLVPCDSHTYQPEVRAVNESEGVVSSVNYDFQVTFVGFGAIEQGAGWDNAGTGLFHFTATPAGEDGLITTGGEVWFVELTGDIPFDVVGPLPS